MCWCWRIECSFTESPLLRTFSEYAMQFPCSMQFSSHFGSYSCCCYCIHNNKWASGTYFQVFKASFFFLSLENAEIFIIQAETLPTSSLVLAGCLEGQSYRSNIELIEEKKRRRDKKTDTPKQMHAPFLIPVLLCRNRHQPGVWHVCWGESSGSKWWSCLAEISDLALGFHFSRSVLPVGGSLLSQKHNSHCTLRSPPSGFLIFQLMLFIPFPSALTMGRDLSLHRLYILYFYLRFWFSLGIVWNSSKAKWVWMSKP